jgi:hypothetical protein
MASATILEKGAGRVDEHGLLFEYTIKLLVLSAFFELVLYRLVSRLGMHLSKLAAKYEAVRLLFKGLSSIGFTLLNVVSLLLFLAFSLFLMSKFKDLGRHTYDTVVTATVSLLLVLTIAFLLVPPAMLGSIAYNVVTCVVLAVLATEYLRTHTQRSQRAMMVCFLLGVFGWLYYQTVSTFYGVFQWVTAPPLVHELNRFGEAMMVLASILAFWAYGGISLRSTNKRQRHRLIFFTTTAAGLFFGLLFLDYFLGLYDKALAESVRKAGEGIGWIFQMGMGYTFYLPFALYVAGLFCWSYTVIKQISMGRLAGYGLALMFMAGYALQLSHLTLMVVFGLLLLTMDRRRTILAANASIEGKRFMEAGSLETGSMVGERV